jgi:hypothetical protein
MISLFHVIVLVCFSESKFARVGQKTQRGRGITYDAGKPRERGAVVRLEQAERERECSAAKQIQRTIR